MGPMATGRYHSLDALRGAMMLLGIYLHATVAYSRYGSWPWKDGSTTGLFDVSLGLIHVFRMPVFYCIAGFFGALLLEQRGAVGFLRNRAVRILLPFAVGWAVLFPLVAALATTAMNLALEITADRILRYVVYRQEQRAANATINRELASLRRMFILAFAGCSSSASEARRS
ncbi:MAG TPA: acyltransferase family protein [Candidatus Acidoferrales bacterium]|nr:acyltransferase family protein [Candidatus Acidoferrales bacterium]